VEQVNRSLPDFLECAYFDDAGEVVGGNPDCLFSRVQGTSKAVEKMAIAFSKIVQEDAPAIAADVKRMADSGDRIGQSAASVGESVAKEAKALTAPQTKLQALRQWLLVAARVYGAI
jgi:hypothetical protein